MTQTVEMTQAVETEMTPPVEKKWRVSSAYNVR